MSGEVFLIAGGVLAAAVIAFILIKNKGDNSEIASVTDDQLVVTQLSSSDITAWFKEKNPDGRCTNLVILANSETLGKIDLPAESLKECKELLKESKNVVLQAVIDNENDDNVLTRAVLFDTMTEKLEKLLNENNGVLIIE